MNHAGCNKIIPAPTLLAVALVATLQLAGIARADDLADLRAELSILRAEQARLAELQKKNESALLTLESRLAMTGQTVAPPAPSATPTPTPSDAKPYSTWTVTGDFRVRNQLDTSDQRAPDRDRSQIRARLAATYRLNDWLRIGARAVTGDPDDPKSSDAQIQTWNNDLQTSLDLAYLQMDFGHTSIYAGKFPQIFARTELVWDGDVTLSGIGATHKKILASGASVRSSAAIFFVDEQAVGPDSRMGGLQVGYDSPSANLVRFDVSAGLYRYQIGSIANANKIDFRSNLRRPDGVYLSDYHIGDLIVGATWPRPDSAWPIRVVADFAKNFGAANDRNEAYGIDLIMGRAAKAGDLRLAYGYSKTEVDAVLAAFSTDNIGLGTNYRLHALTIDYTPTARTQLSGIWYHYKQNDPAFVSTYSPTDWLNRFRLYFQVNF
ncbi:MAG: hypothetical protein EBZ40_01450 [Gammaproteobacteria bacterium]|nr:hypothetical protein [Gammaproteobacteria bacterium]